MPIQCYQLNDRALGLKISLKKSLRIYFETTDDDGVNSVLDVVARIPSDLKELNDFKSSNGEIELFMVLGLANPGCICLYCLNGFHANKIIKNEMVPFVSKGLSLSSFL